MSKKQPIEDDRMNRKSLSVQSPPGAIVNKLGSAYKET